MSDLFETIRKEDAEIKESQKRRYTAGEFEGPLDFLCQLIHDNKINIHDIPIAEITEQYLEYLDFVAQTDLGDLSEFYRMAAKLLYIKSRMMLPVDIEFDDDDEDPREELVDLIIEHQKFKKISVLLEQKEEENEWTFERKKVSRMLPFDENDIWERIDTWELLQQMQKMVKNFMSAYSDPRVINMTEEISVQEKITLMNEMIEKAGECLFSDLIIRRGNELDVVCAFMAILEAVKNHTISIFQNRMYGDIKLTKYMAA